MRKLLVVILVPPLLIAVTLLVAIGLKDFDLLVAIVSRLMIVAIIIGIPVTILKMIIIPKKKENRRR